LRSYPNACVDCVGHEVAAVNQFVGPQVETSRRTKLDFFARGGLCNVGRIHFYGSVYIRRVDGNRAILWSANVEC